MQNHADRKLKYLVEGKSGTLIYTDAQGELRFYFEFGGGDCVVAINVPTTERWVTETKRTPESRLPVLTFIAEKVIQDKAPSCYFKLSENYIEIYE